MQGYAGKRAKVTGEHCIGLSQCVCLYSEGASYNEGLGAR
jgi:hypothetical protein